MKGTISEKMLLNTKCVFWFSLQLLSETFLILRRTERDMIKNVSLSLRKGNPLYLSHLMKTSFSIQFFGKKTFFEYKIS